MGQCPHCGFGVTDDSKCPNCGQSLDALPAYQNDLSGQGTTPPPQPAPQPKDGDQQESVSQAADGPEPAPEEDANGRLGGKLSRRALLGGIGGSVAVLGVGGASWIYLQGGGAGDDIIRSYVDAMNSNSWSQAERQYHDKSPVITQIEESSDFDDYEGLLESQEVLEVWERIEPELKGIEEFYHATEVTEESVSDLRIQLEGESVEMVDEVRSATAFLSVEVGNLDEEQESASDYYEDGRRSRPLTCTLVLIDGEWHLWSTFGLRRYA
jgi:hypothetical protein